MAGRLLLPFASGMKEGGGERHNSRLENGTRRDKRQGGTPHPLITEYEGEREKVTVKWIYTHTHTSGRATSCDRRRRNGTGQQQA